MLIATLNGKGQITLPKEVREYLHLGAGDRLELVIRSDGAVEVRPVAGSYLTLRGMLRQPAQPSAPDEALEQELTRLLAEDGERIRSGGE